ncbi:MAG: hypothetical protein JWO84_796 [Parcubacteria group bacterium]|nr:hypothetical protein [Parcubacteria group bacterium]
MNKSRLEALSDGVFAVAMTLLIFDIKVPAFPHTITDAQLWQTLQAQSPHIIIYAITFIVLSTLWVNHHFLFQTFAKDVDRWLNLQNIIYLMFIAFVPFSAAFAGAYYTQQPAVVIYGLNLLAITFMSVVMVAHVKETQGVEHLSDRLLNQSRFRLVLSIVCYLIGLVLSFWNPYASLAFYNFPILFNFIPGTLDFTERLFKLDLG